MAEIRAGQVIAPSSAEEAAAVMRSCVTAGLQVRCAGTNAAPRHDAVVISSANLNAIAEYEPADLVLSAEAGATLPQIAKATTPHNQFLALDPALHAEASLGATVATGAAGPLRFAHGTPRDQVLGLQIVAGDGRILEFGGKVVKNVAGYDIVRLLVGSRGTLGFITRANVRLKPIPAVDRTVTITFASVDAAIDIVDAVRAAHLDAVGLELISPPLAADWTLLARLHGNEAAVMDAAARLQTLAGTAPVELTASDDPWLKIRAAESAAPVCIRVANLPSLLRETMRTAQRIVTEAEIANPAIAIHAGDGIVRVIGSSAGRNAAATLDAARAEMSERGGSLIVERIEPALPIDAFGRLETVELMRQIKRVFDPAGILGAGRFAL